MFPLAVLTVAAVVLVPSSAYTTGVPVSMCDSMIPSCHGYQSQSTVIAYEVVPSKSIVKPNEEITVYIRSFFEGFKGFLLEIRDENDKAVGKFLVPRGQPNYQTLDCHGGIATAAAQNNGFVKRSASLQWVAPSEKKTYSIFVTIVKNYAVYWARRNMGTIKVE